MPYTPGDEIAQGAPAEVGGLNPILALIMKLLGAQQPAPPPAIPWAQGGAPGQLPPQQTKPDLKGKMTQGR